MELFGAQLEGAGLQPRAPPSFINPGAPPQQAPAHGGPGIVPPPFLEQAFSGTHSHGPPQQQQQLHDSQLQMQHPLQFPSQSQHGPQHAQQQQQGPAGPDVGQSSASVQPPQAPQRPQSRSPEPQEQQLVSLLMHLLPPGEENAVHVSHELDQAVQVKFRLAYQSPQWRMQPLRLNSDVQRCVRSH